MGKINTIRWTLIVVGYIGLILELTKVIETTMFTTMAILCLFVASLLIGVWDKKRNKQEDKKNGSRL